MWDKNSYLVSPGFEPTPLVLATLVFIEHFGIIWTEYLSA